MRKFWAGIVLATLVSGTAGFATPAAALDDKQKQEMGDFIHDYLIAHPEVLLEAQDALQKKQAEAEAARSAAQVSANEQDIFHSKDDVVLGNPNGNVSIVEFYDYNCPYCRHAISDMNDLIKHDNNLRFVLKELPILGPDSEAAHRVSFAVRELAPEKYPAFHEALLGGTVRATQASAMAIAEKLGLKEADIAKQMAAQPNDEAVKKTYTLAQSLGITGTPAYVIGTEVISGAVGEDTLKQKIANMRNCGKSSC
ncbi:DsbA family protein [Allorhizobium sp. BGMRC 0089]|nr:DsbA family protein [Allorhizobium sonneratiae]MCM2294309.1 DsbA family protein [Allorhizobium sonneratiae]